MLSLQRCRSFLPESADLTDAELENVRDRMVSLAHIALDLLKEDRPAIVESEMLPQLRKINNR